MVRKSFMALLCTAVLSLSLAVFAGSYDLAETDLLESALELPLQPSFLQAEVPSNHEPILGEVKTALTEECIECLLDCMASTGYNAAICRVSFCQQECS